MSTITQIKASKTLTPWVLRNLPPYRPIARKLMQLTSDEGVHLAKVWEVLRMDAAFSAEVLRLANSPLLGARHEITSILHAVAILGLDRIKALTATLAVRMFLTGKPSDALQACWRRNLTVALLAERLARHADLNADACYTAGLLHDIGRLALLWASPGRYEEILAQSEAGGLNLLHSEKSAFGVDHCEAGEWILTQWGFPHELVEVALLHHRKPEPGACGLLPTVYVALRIADLLKLPVPPDQADLAEVIEFLPARSRQNIQKEFDQIAFSQIADDTALRINAMECSLL